LTRDGAGHTRRSPTSGWPALHPAVISRRVKRQTLGLQPTEIQELVKNR
jgi:hypothetical protein